MKKIILLMMIGVFCWTGCSTKVIRKDVTDVIDLSGRWNDTDARLTAEEMVESCLKGEWLFRFNRDQGRLPVVIVGTVLNQTHEHINTGVLISDLERELINSSRVRFVADKSQRDEVREERVDQQRNAEVSTRAKMIHETGADYMIKGSINSVKDQTSGQYAILFQVNLELIDMTTNEKVWIGQKKLKKLVKNPKYSM